MTGTLDFLGGFKGVARTYVMGLIWAKMYPHFWGGAEVKCHGTDRTGQIGALGNNKYVNLISIK